MPLSLFLGIPVETVPGLGYIEAGGARMVLGWGVDTIMAIWVGHRGLVAGGWGRKCDHFDGWRSDRLISSDSDVGPPSLLSRRRDSPWYFLVYGYTRRVTTSSPVKKTRTAND